MAPSCRPSARPSSWSEPSSLDRVEAIVFDPHIESLISKAAGVVAMGGYNTFCEILSLDKRALIVPRERPRMEQTIRARRAQQLGLVRMLAEDPAQDPKIMADALRALPQQNRPSKVVVPGLLEGLDNVNRLMAPWIEGPAAVPLAVAQRQVL